jgi:hypothetical protein
MTTRSIGKPSEAAVRTPTRRGRLVCRTHNHNHATTPHTASTTRRLTVPRTPAFASALLNKRPSTTLSQVR